MKSTFADQQLSMKALERLLSTLSLAQKGDFSVRMAADGDGVEREVADALNGLLGMLAEFTKEFERVAESVTQGELRARVPLDKASGGWGQQLRAINNILAVFGKHAAEIRRVIKSVHTGDLTRLVAVGPEAVHRGGELQRLAEDMNQMIAHVDRLTAEITRVFAEVGLDGRLNAQCHLSDASGSWALLVGSVNAASASLSEQVQDLCATATAIAAGNLAARASVTSRGDLQTLKLGLNGAAEGMFGLCSELRRIAQEVTNEGKLSVQMQHPNPRGEWQVTQDAANRMWQALAQAFRSATAGTERLLRGEPVVSEAEQPGELGLIAKHLTLVSVRDQRLQLRMDALAGGKLDVAAVGGDSIPERALARIAALLKHEWLRASRASVLEAREASGDPDAFARNALALIARIVDAAVGAYHVRRDSGYVCAASFGWDAGSEAVRVTRVGEGLVGRVAAEGEPLVLEDLEDHGVRVRTSLIEVVPRSVLIFPIKDESGVAAIIELGFVRGQVLNARELLAFVAPDLARGPRPAQVLDEARAATDRTRALEEELVINSARLESMTHELQQRDKSLRELQLELQRVRGVVSQPPGEVAVPRVQST
ncbi:MAG TPA: GAF domain-containing protein [Polyangiales bacterium]|nr:GAF domain-containing protein [Polyangiales bacterium]